MAEPRGGRIFGSPGHRRGLCYLGLLLQRYSAGVVAPFALLAPCTGVVSSTVLFGEVFSPLRYSGMALILGGLAVIVLPAGWLAWLHPGRRHPTTSGDGSCDGLTEDTLRS